MANLLVGSDVVEVPFVTVKIGEAILGVYQNSLKNGKTVAQVNTPNYIRDLSIVKINGAVNQYSLNIVYGITQFTDPNYIEKILSSVSTSRTITFSYGDFNSPSFIYKSEEAIITNVSSSVNFANSQLTYNIRAISSCALSKSIVRNWPMRRAKPSSLIAEIVTNNAYGLNEIFTGMQKPNIITQEHLIATDDETVEIEAKQNMNAFDYLNYLTSCMVSITDKNAIYILTVYDTNDAPMYGTYFKVTKVQSDVAKNHNPNAFNVDVGFPTDTFVMDFSIQTNDSWSILYDYSQNQIQSNNSYLIDDDGNLIPHNTNKFVQNIYKGTVESEQQKWWKQVTEFPIKASLTIKGLLKPANLMQYVNINCYFYGQKYIASGLYIITKQTDTISQSGYRTTLELLRIGGSNSDLYEEINSSGESKYNTNYTLGVASTGRTYTQSHVVN